MEILQDLWKYLEIIHNNSSQYNSLNDKIYDRMTMIVEDEEEKKKHSMKL